MDISSTKDLQEITVCNCCERFGDSPRNLAAMIRISLITSSIRSFVYSPTPRRVRRLFLCMTVTSSGAVTTFASGSSTMKIFASRSLSSREILGADAASDFEKRLPVGVVCTADSEVEGLWRRRSATSTSSTAPIFTCFSGAASVGTLRKLGRFTSWEVSSSPSSGIEARKPLLSLLRGELVALEFVEALEEQVLGRRSASCSGNKSWLGGGSTSISGGEGLGSDGLLSRLAAAVLFRTSTPGSGERSRGISTEFSLSA
mmetsp:Transcript_77281/g.170705  ORF Transcript_77281/g.170705 Transcript_77281/m.170705 type:complete len:259 (+) Transcript_77281:1707-2483(+)